MNWYLCRKGLLSGPFTTPNVLKEIQSGKVLWTDPIWTVRIGEKQWVRVCDVPAFRTLMPKLPSQKLIDEIISGPNAPSGTLLDSLAPLQSAFADLVKKIAGMPTKTGVAATGAKGKTRSTRTEKSKRTEHTDIWYLISDGSEFGPLTLREAVLILKSGKLKGTVLGRKEGMESPLVVDSIPELAVNADTFKKLVRVKSHEGADKRTSQRAPLLAEVHFSSGEGVGDLSVYSGICRDVSSLGMLILATRCPTTVGVKVKLEIVPIKNQGIESFVTSAEVVRVLPDKNGFSVRFEKMPESALAALTKYIAGKS